MYRKALLLLILPLTSNEQLANNIHSEAGACTSRLLYRLVGYIQLKREDKDMLIEKLGKGEKK